MLKRRTDLALEAAQLWQESAGEAGTLPGVESEEATREGYPVTTVRIRDEAGARALGKPVGTYVTLELDGLARREEDAFGRAARALAAELGALLGLEPGAPALVVGLGNPGEKYENTRHNVGFLTVDELAERARVPVQKLKHRALTNTLEVGGVKVLLMKPVTYMNLSGEAVGEAARFYKLPPERVLVISDDVSLPVGKLRIRKGGSAGGHNGLKSIIQHLGTDQFPRIKVGVGQKPHPDYDMADWVLSKFAGEDLKTITEAIRKAADAVECLIQEGPDKAMNRFNG